jgi:hypothetical protein
MLVWQVPLPTEASCSPHPTPLFFLRQGLSLLYPSLASHLVCSQAAVELLLILLLPQVPGL